jgi:hypothetical protein
MMERKNGYATATKNAVTALAATRTSVNGAIGYGAMSAYQYVTYFRVRNVTATDTVCPAKTLGKSVVLMAHVPSHANKESFTIACLRQLTQNVQNAICLLENVATILEQLLAASILMTVRMDVPETVVL